MNLRSLSTACVLAVAVAIAPGSGMPIPGGTAGAFAAPIDFSETLRWYDQDDGDGNAGEVLASYTALAASGPRWRGRASLSWWSWRADGAQAAPDDSGPGSIYLTVGRLVWKSYRPSGSNHIWVQLKGTVPLQSSPSFGSSGAFDWGGSVLSSNRIRDFLLFAEVGYLSLGDPVGIAYNGQYSAAVSLSWHPGRSPVYPVASLVGASAAIDGDSGYGEWAAGLGALLGRRTGLSALYSQGLTAASPQRGATVVFSRRL